MTINGIGNPVSYFQTQQSDIYQKKTNDRATPEKTEQSAPTQTSKATQVSAGSVSIERGVNYNLKNITPQETYGLAQELYKDESISLDQFIQMQIIGLSHEYSPDQHNTLSNEPFNLLKELDSVASGSHKSLKFDTESSKEDMKSLFELLLSMTEKKEKIQYTSIDITV